MAASKPRRFRCHGFVMRVAIGSRKGRHIGKVVKSSELSVFITTNNLGAMDLRCTYLGYLHSDQIKDSPSKSELVAQLLQRLR